VFIRIKRTLYFFDTLINPRVRISAHLTFSFHKVVRTSNANHSGLEITEFSKPVGRSRTQLFTG